jgi:Ca2+-binding EF-hand superfamily protein
MASPGRGGSKTPGAAALTTWLESLDLGSLAPNLIGDGYDSLERVKLLTEKDLPELNIKKGHASHLMEGIKALKATAGSSAPPLPPASSSVPIDGKVSAAVAETFAKPAYAPAKIEDDETEKLLKDLKDSLYQHGARGIVGLGRKFRIMDDDGSNTLDYDEFRKCLAEHAFDLSDTQQRKIFKHFDQDNSGSISYDEFLVGIRGQLNERRKSLVLLAFNVLDLDKSGIITLDEIVKCYNCDKHPEVLSGKKSKGEVFREFLDTFDGGEKDGQVTPDEFCRYYSNVSASIDDDDYFELMIRNAWHLSGGKGAYENTTCRRVLAVHADGRQTVEEIKNDMFIGKDDIPAMMENLKAQGIMDVVKISLTGDVETPPESAKATATAGKAASIPASKATGGVASALGFSPSAASASPPRPSTARGKAHHSKSR